MEKRRTGNLRGAALIAGVLALAIGLVAGASLAADEGTDRAKEAALGDEALAQRKLDLARALGDLVAFNRTLESLIERVMSGGVAVNDALMHVGQDDLPFGGVGESGMGHYHGLEGFNTFSKLRPIFRQSRWATTQLLHPPYGALADRVLAFLTR